MIERINRALRAVPRVLLPLVPLPFVAAAALCLWSVVYLATHGEERNRSLQRLAAKFHTKPRTASDPRVSVLQPQTRKGEK